MKSYQHILLAVDFMPGVEQICQRAKQLAECCDARLSIIHVVEPMIMAPPYEGMPSLPVDFEDQMLDSARDSLRQLIEKEGLEEANWTVEIGAVKWTIIEHAEQWQTDLIVIGSHGRHGLSRLLGSTANAVLHSAPCDVLAVHVENP